MLNPSAPTIHDVAARVGVSKSLVSLVMRGSPKVSDESRRAVLEAAAALGYRPNAAAQALVQQRSHLIGVMVSDFGNPFFSEMLEGIERAALAGNYRALFNTGSRVPERELQATETLLEMRTEGLILASPRYDDETLRRVATTVPVVMVGKDTDLEHVDVVVNDDEQGAEQIVAHLTDLGHERIVHIHGMPGAGAATRREGFVGAMERRGLEPLLVMGGFTEAAGAEGAAVVLGMDPLPTAIFAANDAAAVGVMRVLGEAGLTIPGDISLAGYDNVGFAGLDHIDLTTVDQPRQQIGTLAVEMLLERLGGDRRDAQRVTVEPSLIRRGTTGPPKGHIESRPTKES